MGSPEPGRLTDLVALGLVPDERQREVLRRIEAGSDCPVCGDLGAVDAGTGEGEPCLACGRVGTPDSAEEGNDG